MRPLPNELRELAMAHQGVLALRELAKRGFNTHYVDRRVDRGEWQRLSAGTVATNPLPPSRLVLLFAATVHFRDAVLTGRAALEIAGLPPDPSDRIDIVGARVGREPPMDLCVVHSSRRPLRLEHDLPRRTTPCVSVLNAMAWARSEGQATFIAVTAIQRKLTTLDELWLQSMAINGSRTLAKARKRLAAIPSGADSSLEVEFAKLCAEWGLPAPRRQVPRQDSEGRTRYLDALFEVKGKRLVVEIDGLQHLDVEVKVDDQLRANSLALQGEPVLRIPGIALRTNPAPFMRQLRKALRDLANS